MSLFNERLQVIVGVLIGFPAKANGISKCHNRQFSRHDHLSETMLIVTADVSISRTRDGLGLVT